MSNNMTVVYRLHLASNIAEQAGKDSKLFVDAQQKMEASVGRTGHKLTGLENNLTKLANNTSMQRQIGFMDGLARSIERTTQRAQQLKTIFQQGLGKLPGAVAGGAGALYAADAMTRAPMDFDLQLRYAASTAYGGGSARDIRQGMTELRGLVHGAVRKYGGDRGQALRGYSDLVGSGEFSAAEAKVLLPSLQQASVATNTDVTKLASLDMRLKSGLGIAPQEMGLAHSRLARVGQLGGVELNQMSGLMADLSANYGALGYKGQRGAVAAAVDLQIANKGAGSAEGARTILDNFYGKIFSVDTAKDFSKIQGADGKGIDLNQRMAARMAKGMDGVEAFIDIADSVLAKSGGDKQIQKILANADLKDPGKYAEATAAVKAVYERAGIGSFLQDKEAMRGFMQLRKGMTTRKDMIDTAMGDTGQTMDTLSEVIQDSPEVKRQKLLAESAIAVDGAFRSLSPAIEGLMEATTGLAKEYPAMASAVAALSGAAMVAAAGLGAVGLAGLLTGGAGASGAAGKLLPGLFGAGAAGAAGAMGKMGPPLPGAMKGVRFLEGNMGKVLPGLGFLMDAGGALTDDHLTAEGKTRGVARAGVGGAAGWAGASAGAALGTMLMPGFGTLAGGVVGGALGYFGGGSAFDGIWKPNAERDYVRLTDPKGQPLDGAAAAAGQATTVQLGEGRMTVDVRVTDERVLANPYVTQQPSLVKINPGATNPGGMR